MRHIPQILIGAASSGGGKTTFTTGLLRLLHDKGLSVQPFKCGPDYIDTKYHEIASGHPSVNLDLWLSSCSHVKNIYAKYAASADACVTEGVMGLFDGYDNMAGSSADIASRLSLPVVLVLGAKSVAYTVAPIIYGFKHFCPSVRIAGVVFNQVASDRHFAMLRKACADVGVECFGYLPRMKELEVPSRHLGLTLDASWKFGEFASKVASAIDAHVDVDRMLEVCTTGIAAEYSSPQPMAAGMKFAVARDEAFNFCYRENLSRLEESGSVEFFSPLADEVLPQADLVYLPGGYPEFFLEQLAKNTSMLNSVRDFASHGGKILSECGGMMYLCRSITGMDGKKYDMAGVFGMDATMEGMRLHLGYRTVNAAGQTYRGHEFHYSSITGDSECKNVAEITDAGGRPVQTALYRQGNVFAGYTHLYWGESNILKLWDL